MSSSGEKRWRRAEVRPTLRAEMPTYEYGCGACGNEWELEQRISDNPIKKCPKCGKRRAKRLISGGNFILKGGGWEADLYHKPKSGVSDGVKKLADQTAADAKPSEKKPAKTESKGADKKADKPTKAK